MIFVILFVMKHMLAYFLLYLKFLSTTNVNKLRPENMQMWPAKEVLKITLKDLRLKIMTARTSQVRFLENSKLTLNILGLLRKYNNCGPQIISSM